MITREEAIKIAQKHAYATAEEHAYLPKTTEAAVLWQPHEWVVEAILDAYYRGYEG